MLEKRFVQLDPDATLGRDWMFVVVEAPTSVIYLQQCGGTTNRQCEAEGYLVPVTSEPALGELRHLFEKTLRGTGTERHEWSGDQVRRLRDAVTRVVFWTSDRDTDEADVLTLDTSRMAEVDEAWVPVRTPAGAGVLVWCNSD